MFYLIASWSSLNFLNSSFRSVNIYWIIERRSTGSWSIIDVSPFFIARAIVPGVFATPCTVHWRKPATPPIGFATMPINPRPMPLATPFGPLEIPPFTGSVTMPATPSATPLTKANPPYPNPDKAFCGFFVFRSVLLLSVKISGVLLIVMTTFYNAFGFRVWRISSTFAIEADL